MTASAGLGDLAVSRKSELSFPNFLFVQQFCIWCEIIFHQFNINITLIDFLFSELQLALNFN